MVRRHEGTAFMGGAHVFPGGRVDASDHHADTTWCDGLEHAQRQLASVTADEARAYHVAAARELFEEAGVLLARSANGQFVSLAGADAHARFKQYRSDVHKGTATLRAIVEREALRLAVDSLMLFAHWVTPPIDTRQFDTRFFVTRAPPEQTPAHDETETTHSGWMTPSGAIRQSESGAIVLPPPTWTTRANWSRFGPSTLRLRGRGAVRWCVASRSSSKNRDGACSSYPAIRCIRIRRRATRRSRRDSSSPVTAGAPSVPARRIAATACAIESLPRF